MLKPDGHDIQSVAPFWSFHEKTRNYDCLSKYGLHDLFKRIGIGNVLVPAWSGAGVIGASKLHDHICSVSPAPLRPLIHAAKKVKNQFCFRLDRPHKAETFNGLQLAMVRKSSPR